MLPAHDSEILAESAAANATTRMHSRRRRHVPPSLLSVLLAPILSFGMPLRCQATCGPAVAQGLARVRVTGADPRLARLLAGAHAALRGPVPGSGRPLAMHVLGCLRSGDVAASAAALAQATWPRGDEPAPGTAAWLAIAHLWHARAAGIPALTAASSQALADALTDLAAAPLAADLADAAVHVHGLFAAAGLAAMPPSTDESWQELAVRRLLDLERAAEQPENAAVAAGRQEDSASEPCTDDRLALRLAALGFPPDTDARAPNAPTAPSHRVAATGVPARRTLAASAQHLGAATGVVDDNARARDFVALCAAADHGIAAADAGAVLDAALFAITGARVAIGAGVDSIWQRFAPWLPPGHQWVALHDVLVGGARYDLELEARCGALHADEDDATAHVAGDAPRLCIRLRLRCSVDGMGRIVEIVGRDARTVHWLEPGETFCASLPRRQADAQHDPHRVAARLRGARKAP